MILDDGRKWGRDKVTITLTRRQWVAILTLHLLPYKHDGWFRLFPNYFTEEETRRAGKSIERQLPPLKEHNHNG